MSLDNKFGNAGQPVSGIAPIPTIQNSERSVQTGSSAPLPESVRPAFALALAYGIGGFLSASRSYMAAGESNFHGELVIQTGLLVILPALLMLLRRGYASAGALALYAGFNMLGCLQGTLSGIDGYGWLSVLFHGFFLSIFAQTAHQLWKTRST